MFANTRSGEMTDVDFQCDQAREIEALTAQRDELLAALKQCVTVLTDPVIGTYEHDDPDWYQAVAHAVAIARNAIAKAQGGGA